MEPMTLGSPPSSPSTSPNINPNYLPAFLLGETPSHTPTRGNSSPSKNRSFGYKTPTSGAEQRALHHRLFSQTPQEQPSFNLSTAVPEKIGPPSRGLFDDKINDTSEPSNRQIVTSPGSDLKKSYTSPNQSFNYSRNLNDSLSKSHPFKKLDDSALWVTVLGFPPHAASLVLAQFAQCGTITEKKFPQEGNWLHLKFSARHEVAKALSYNGKLICNTIMVGVVPYNSSENKENSHSEFTPITSPNRARSLTQPYVVNHSAEIASPQNVPQRSTGLVTKAMEYVFGW